jgi:pyrimidine-specific ribonucleoside hydrolase
MKRKILVISGIAFGMLVCLLILVWPAAPLWQKLGVEPVCIQGDWPNFQIVSCQQPAKGPPTVTPLPLPTLKGHAPVPIIVDDDGSPDGVIALLYFLRNPLFDVRAVTVSYGEAHPEVFARHVAQLLAGLGRADIPVGVGRATPLEGNNAFPDPWRESSDHFWGISLPSATISTEPVPAAELIVETVARSSQPVMVFISGSHTNLAEALRLKRSIVQNIRDVYIMGGAIHVRGNIESDWPSINNRVSEWNIWVDPEAARQVFASGLGIHLVPLDATQQIVWTRSDLSGWISSNSPEGAWAGKLSQWMLQSWSSKSVYIWDLVAAVQATNPASCPEVSLAVSIVTTPGPEQGRTIVTKDVPNAAICLDPDPKQVKALAASMLVR